MEVNTETQIANQSLNWLNKQAQSFEKSRFAIMTLLLTAQSCLGSVACLYILRNEGHALILALCAGVTMASNALFIAQASAKTCLLFFYISVVFNSLLILLFALFS